MSEQIQKYSFKEGLSLEFEILEISNLYNDFYDDISNPHRAEFYQIIWFDEGNTTHLVDFKTVPIANNTLLFIPKNSIQQFSKKSNGTGRAILFTDHFFCKTKEDIHFLKNTILFNDLLSISQIKIQDELPVFSAILNQIEIELKKPVDNYQSEIVKNLLKTFLLQAERLRRKQDFIEIKKDTHLNHVLKFKELLETSFITHKQVSYYCNKMNVTSKTLNKSTLKVLGTSPKHIIDERVLLEAKRILAHTNDSIKEIGYLLGFEEATNFIKYFKKHTKQTPLDFRTTFTME